MSFRENKIEIAIAGFAVVLFGGLGYLLKSPVQTAMKEIEVIYEMPRPKSFLAALFELGDREISREYKNPFAKKTADAKAADPAKAAAAKPAVKPVAAAKKTVKKATPDKKPSVDVQIVGADPTGPKASEESFSAAGSVGAGLVAQTTAQPDTTNSDTETKGMSGDQWRALILAQPTAENIVKLVAAYNKQEVDEATFFTIVADLFRNNKSETQAMGLTAASSVYSAKSFSTVAEYYDQLTAEVQTKAHAYLLTYGTSSSRLGFLKTVLASTDADLVSTATEVVIAGYQSAKQGNTGVVLSDRGGSRGGELNSSSTVSAFAQFVPVFQQLAASQDSAIASLATSALSQIQTTVAAL